MSILQRAIGGCVALTLVLSACGGDDESTGAAAPTAEPTATPEPEPEPTATAPPAPTATPEPAPEGVSLDELVTGATPDPQGWIVLPPDTYVTDSMGVTLGFELGFEGDLFPAPSGPSIRIPDLSATDLALVAVVQPARVGEPERLAGPVGAVNDDVVIDDLGSWLSRANGVAIVGEGTTKIGETTVPWWDVEFDPSSDVDLDAHCDERCVVLFETSPDRGWWMVGGTRQRLWEIQTDAGLLVGVVEAGVADFDAALELGTPVMESLTIGARTGASPGDAYAPLAGDHQMGITRLTLVDETRPTDEVNKLGTVVVPAADSRTIGLTIGYPAAELGPDTTPAEGSFPLVLVLHGLGGSGGITAQSEALVRAGHVVAALDFPASSWPASDFGDYVNQPGDVSFVLDQLLGPDAPEPVAGLVDGERVGLLGLSLGGSTAHGATAWSCCQDDRIDTVVSHAGLPLSFDGDPEWDQAPPTLVIGSPDDIIAPMDQLRTITDELGAGSALLELSSGGHLQWAFGRDPNFVTVVDLLRSWFAVHLGDEDPAAIAEAAAAVDGTLFPAG